MNASTAFLPERRPAPGIFSVLLLTAISCSLLSGGPAVQTTDSGKPAFTYRFNGETHDELGGVVSDGSGGAYLLASRISSATLVRVDSKGKELWRTGVDFGATSLAAGGNGVYLVGSLRDIDAKVNRPYIALVDGGGNLIWKIEPPPPVEVENAGERESIQDLSASGDFELWKAVPAPGGGVAAVGVGEGPQGSLVWHVRVDEHGKIMWENYTPAQYNWMKTGATMGKYQPYLAAAAGYIISVGAWNAEGGSGELAAYKIDPSSGEIAARYVPSGGDRAFLSAAAEIQTGRLAVAYSSSGSAMGVLFLDGDFQKLADAKTSIAIRSDLAWATDGSVWIAGWLKGTQQFVNHPACERLDPSSAAAGQQSNWPEAQAVDALDVALVGDTCLVAYAENLSGKPDVVDNARVVVRECSGGGDPLFSYHQGDVYQGNPILEPFEGGFWLALYHGANGPVLVKFDKV